jgi:hypothetical protein
MVRPDGIPEELDALIAKVEAVTGPDRDLDHWLSSLMIEGGGSEGFGFYRDRASWVTASIENRWNAGRYTASIDDAVAFADRQTGRWWGMLRSAVEDIGRTTKPASDLPHLIILEALHAIRKGAQ